MKKQYRYLALTCSLLLQLTMLASTADSLRQILPRLEDEEKSKAYEQLMKAFDDEGKIDSILTCFDEWIEHEQQRGDATHEASVRWNKMVMLTNYGKDSLLLDDAPKQMTWFMHHNEWEHYYDTWDSKVNVLLYTGRVQAALREAHNILDDATSRNNRFGRALAYQLLGVIYETMGQYDEAIKVFRRCIKQLKSTNHDTEVLANTYDYLCQTLDEHGDYKGELAVAKEWEQHINAKVRKSQIAMASYVICRCCKAAALTGMKRFDEAEQELREAEKLQTEENTPLGQYRILYIRAHHALAKGEPAKAMDYLTQLEQMKLQAGGGTEMLRADILQKLGRSAEAAALYRQLYFRKDSLFSRDMRMQLDELNTLYKVDELEMQGQLQRSYFLMGLAALIAVGLLLLTILRYRSAMKLEKEHILLQESNEKLEKSYQELKLANEQAEESSKMKTNFIQQISHEIRTPLNILSGFTQLITSGTELDDAMRKEVNENISVNTRRITELVNKMLELSDATTRTVIERTDDVPALQIAAQAADDARLAQSKEVAFELQYDPDVESVVLHTNLQQAIRALVLLLDNAQKFIPEPMVSVEGHPKGTVRIRIERKGRQIAFVVEDTGIGVPAEEAEHIFEEFVQLDEYKDGTGIGLTVSRSIARRLGGNVVLDPSYTYGARFVFTLPL